jgi:hypothetical protein
MSSKELQDFKLHMKFKLLRPYKDEDNFRDNFR